MFTTTIGEYAISVQQGSLPAIYGDYKKHAQLADELALRPHQGGELCFVAASKAHHHWPTLVVAQRFELAEAGFDPAALLAPDGNGGAGTLFIGAGRRLLGYRIDRPARLFEDTTDAGFWEWTRYGDVIVMSGELELAAWDTSANKLWSMPLEPAWEYSVDREMVHLNVMGRRTVFPLLKGPQQAAMER